MATKRRSFGKLRTIGSGRIHASYVWPEGETRHNAPSTFDTKMDAEAWLKNERRLIELDAWTPPKARARKGAANITVEDYVTQWIAERDLSSGTRALYNTHARKRIYPSLGDTPVAEVTPALVRAWWAGMGKQYPTARRHAYIVLRAVMNTAVEDKLLAENPCRITQKAPEERDVEALDIEELDIVAGEVMEHYRVAVYILAWTSLRFGEMIELRRKDIVDDGETMKFRVRRGAARIGNTIEVGNTKTARSKRPVTVPPHVADMVREHMQKRMAKDSEALLVTTSKGLRLSKSALTGPLKRGYAKIGRPELRIHDLRAVGATYAAQSGATTKELMARLGHTTPRMAMKYQLASEARDEALAQRMSELVKA